jgi:hypothetical protein
MKLPTTKYAQGWDRFEFQLPKSLLWQELLRRSPLVSWASLQSKKYEHAIEIAITLFHLMAFFAKTKCSRLFVWLTSVENEKKYSSFITFIRHGCTCSKSH